jgi:hypothetical protein
MSEIYHVYTNVFLLVFDTLLSRIKSGSLFFNLLKINLLINKFIIIIIIILVGPF